MVHAVDSTEPPKLPQVWGADKARAARALSGMPNEVRIDTSLSEDCAIIEVFTIDRAGLLYDLARTLHDCGLVIRFAKIATSLDKWWTSSTSQNATAANQPVTNYWPKSVGG